LFFFICVFFLRLFTSFIRFIFFFPFVAPPIFFFFFALQYHLLK